MTERDLKTQSEEWFETADRNLNSAKILFNNEGHLINIGVDLQQAVETGLKGYLIDRGWRLVKTHDLEELLLEASKYEKSLESYLDYCRQLTVIYTKDKYPGRTMMRFDRPKMKELIEIGDRLIVLLKGETNG